MKNKVMPLTCIFKPLSILTHKQTLRILTFVMSSFFYVYTLRAKYSDIFLSIRAVWLPSFIRMLDWLILVLALNKQADLLCIHTHNQISVVVSQMLWIHPKFDTELWIIPFYMEHFYTPSMWWDEKVSFETYPNLV